MSFRVPAKRLEPGGRLLGICQVQAFSREIEALHRDANLGDDHFACGLPCGSKDEAGEIVETACKQLLANMVMESYQYEISEA